MKLSHVTISNVATFPYIADLHDGSGVNFSIQEKGNIHIFIGPNGAGKSTFLDIIQQVCSSIFFQPYVCNIQHLSSIAKENSQQLIHHKPVSLHNLHENLAGKGKPSLVFLTFVLNEQDRTNMQFVYEHQQEINNLIATYSTSPVRFSYKGIEQYIKSYEQITCKVQLDLLANKGYPLDTHLEDIERFIYDYCSHFYLLQHCITIHNELDKEKKEYWHSLHATLAVMGSYRNLLHYNDTYTIGEDVHAHIVSDLLQDAAAVSIKTAQDHLTGLLYLKKKLCTYLNAQNAHATAFDIQQLLSKVPLFQEVQQLLHQYLQRALVVLPVEDQPGSYRFVLQDCEHNTYYLDDLSAGEKSVFGLICVVYGFYLEQGLLVIDEPELHLHPQLQKQILLLLEHLTEKFGMQCIITTHSSLMVNENNIKYVYRFHTDHGMTHIITPSEHYNEESGKLMQILRFTNTAKIFFVQKIIMVEGETDEYAFGYYLQHLAKHKPEWADILRDYEIININGKGGYARRKKFLNNFGIESYFIGDWDNIQETGHEPLDIHRYEKAILRHRDHGFETKSDKYQAIIEYLKLYEPKHWDDIQASITDLYKRNVFILQRGDIEAYLGMHEKGLEETVQFFSHDFDAWMADERYNYKRAELELIFAHIFSKTS